MSYLSRIPISFVPSKSSQTIVSNRSTSEEEDKEKLVKSITKFYQSVISFPPTIKKKKVRKNNMNITCKKQQGVIDKKSITNNSDIKDCFSQLNFVGTDNESFSNSLGKLSEYGDEDEGDIKHFEKKRDIESVKDTTKIIKNNNVNNGKSSANVNENNKIWCVDCEVWVEKHSYQNHIHSTAHLVVSKSLNDQYIPDPLTLNETNVGFRMLRDQGWSYEKGLGVNEQGRRHPIPTRLKNDRLGIGVKPTNQPPKMILKLKRLNAKQTAAQYEKDRKDRIRMLAYMNRL